MADVAPGDTLKDKPRDALGNTPRPELTSRQMGRYERQMVLPEVGVDGQRQLLASRVLVVGAGALGSAAATYLTAAGVGTIGLADGDTVDLSNLHRQILHDDSQIGKLKTKSGVQRLNMLNPEVRVEEHSEFISSANVLRLFADYDLIVNGSDNFPTRYLVNDTAVILNKPLVDAAILRFEGHLAVYTPGYGCYRCLFPTPPPPGTVPDCAQAGIFGAVAGVLGSMQAVEALKVLLNVARPPFSKLLVYDALSSNWQRMPFHRDPDCVVCGDHPSITSPTDDENFCGVPFPQSQRGFEAESPNVPRDSKGSKGQETDRPNGEEAMGVTVHEVEVSGRELDHKVEAQTEMVPVVRGQQRSQEELSVDGFSVNVDQAVRMMSNPRLIIVDVRSKVEFASGHIDGAVHCALENLDSLSTNQWVDGPLLVICAAGVRSAYAAKYLRSRGFQAWTLIGGMRAWLGAGQS